MRKWIDLESIAILRNVAESTANNLDWCVEGQDRRPASPFEIAAAERIARTCDNTLAKALEGFGGETDDEHEDAFRVRVPLGLAQDDWPIADDMMNKTNQSGIEGGPK